METVVAIAAGLGLSAACGFRVFVPPLIACVAVRMGQWDVADDSWLRSDAALIVLSVATVLECIAYLVPWLDHLLDSVATPAATIAGIVMTASMLADSPEWLRWSLALIVGGGSATTVQLGSVAIRSTSTVTTGGLANPVIAILEAVGSVFLSFMAVLVPLFAALLAIAILAFIFRRLQSIHRWWKTRGAKSTEDATAEGIETDR
jgi:hypothetical protein